MQKPPSGEAGGFRGPDQYIRERALVAHNALGPKRFLRTYLRTLAGCEPVSGAAIEAFGRLVWACLNAYRVIHVARPASWL